VFDGYPYLQVTVNLLLLNIELICLAMSSALKGKCRIKDHIKPKNEGANLHPSMDKKVFGRLWVL